MHSLQWRIIKLVNGYVFFLFRFEKSEHCCRPKENHVYRIHIKLCALLFMRKMKHMTKNIIVYHLLSVTFVHSFIHVRCHRYCHELWICDLSTNHISYVQLLSECRFALLLTHSSANRSSIYTFCMQTYVEHILKTTSMNVEMEKKIPTSNIWVANILDSVWLPCVFLCMSVCVCSFCFPFFALNCLSKTDQYDPKRSGGCQHL